MMAGENVGVYRRQQFGQWQAKLKESDKFFSHDEAFFLGLARAV